MPNTRKIIAGYWPDYGWTVGPATERGTMEAPIKGIVYDTAEEAEAAAQKFNG